MSSLIKMGFRFGCLTAIAFAGTVHRHRYWSVQCRCGAIKSVRESDLLAGKSKSCGCAKQRPDPIDYTGALFGALLIKARAPNKRGHRCWFCRCECGKERVIREYSLTSGPTISCGCARVRACRLVGLANRVHGHSFGGRGSKWHQLPSAFRSELSRYAIRGRHDRRGRRGILFRRARLERLHTNQARRKSTPPGHSFCPDQSPIRIPPTWRA